jgi:hypothetical protein
VKNRCQKRWFIAQLFVLPLKNSYLCIVIPERAAGADKFSSAGEKNFVRRQKSVGPPMNHKTTGLQQVANGKISQQK